MDAKGIISDLRKDERDLVQKQALSWFDSKDHKVVCGLAGVDPDKVKP